MLARAQARGNGQKRPLEPPKKMAAALVRRHSHLDRRLAAPRRLAVTRGSNRGARASMDSSKKEHAAAKKMTATSLPMVVVMAVEAHVPSCSESNIGKR